MQDPKRFPHIGLGIAAGVIIGLVVALVTSTDFFRPTTVVEFQEAARAPAPPAGGTGQAVSYADAVDIAAPAVVNVYTTKTITRRRNPFFDDPMFRRFFGDMPAPQSRRETSLGSGVIVSIEGYVLTNNHVIDGSDEILVALTDGRTTPAEVVGTDPETDIAVLRVALADLPSITFGRSDQLRVGDVVLAIGNPFGVGQTVTQGIISATGRNQLGISTFENFIQTDAAINPGNSGGALVNPYGELVGINTAIFSRTGGSQGIGFAIPMSIVQDVMKQIIEHGHAIRGWLGVEIQTLTPALAESFGLTAAKGVIIAGVLRGGPANLAGLEPGDIVTRIGGRDITDFGSALAAIAQAPPGTALEVSGLREGKPFALRAIVGKRPPPRSR